jgi:FkbM family methyltransferase
MNEPILTYGKVRLLNVPKAKVVADEIFVENCYKLEQLPLGSIVLDVGAMYGEFGIYCAVELGCEVFLYEPSPSWEIAGLNLVLNRMENISSRLFPFAIGEGRPSVRKFSHSVELPYTSRLDDLGGLEVPCNSMAFAISQAKLKAGSHLPICVKLDCEGAEREIFNDESWLEDVSIVMLEFHFKDGPRYREILQRKGFFVTSNDDNPEAMRAIIHASRNCPV